MVAIGGAEASPGRDTSENVREVAGVAGPYGIVCGENTAATGAAMRGRHGCSSSA